MKKQTLTSKLMNEVVVLGGLPMTRQTAFQVVTLTTGEKKAADYAAFSAKVGFADPMSFGEVKALMGLTEEMIAA